MRLDYQYDHAFTFSRRNMLDFRNHAQGEIEFGIMLSGSCRFICGNVQTVLSAGDAFFAFPNQPHCYEGSRNADAYLLIVPVKRYLSEYYNILMKQVPEYPVLHACEYDPEVLSLMESAYRELPGGSIPVIQGYLMVIMGKLLRSLRLQPRQQGAEEALYRILQYVNDHYRESITRGAMAKAAGYNESYISHLFSQTMGTTIPEYVHAMRVDDACRLLVETDRTVAQISAELGFGSIRSFNRVFLQRTGMTPTAFRNTAKEKEEATD